MSLKLALTARLHCWLMHLAGLLLLKWVRTPKIKNHTLSARGGLALTSEWRYLGTQQANLTIRSDRKEHPPYGLYGGCPGAISTNIINPETKRERIVPTMVTDTLLPGEVIRHVQPGGGGWGNPLNRDPKIVLMDVLNHKVSLSKPKEDYGVCINPKTMKIKYKATEKKRYALKSKTYK